MKSEFLRTRFAEGVERCSGPEMSRVLLTGLGFHKNMAPRHTICTSRFASACDEVRAYKPGFTPSAALATQSALRGSPSAPPARQSAHQSLRRAAPAMNSDSSSAQSGAPATSPATEGAQKVAPATKLAVPLRQVRLLPRNLLQEVLKVRCQPRLVHFQCSKCQSCHENGCRECRDSRASRTIF